MSFIEKIKSAVGMTTKEVSLPEEDVRYLEQRKALKEFRQQRVELAQEKALEKKERWEGTVAGKVARVISNVGRRIPRQPISVPMRQRIAGTIGYRLPIKSQSKKQGYRGRPRGPSGRYFIPGVGSVGVYQFRKWASQQKLARRMAYEAQMQAIQQNPQLAQMYAEGKISPQNISESEVLNAPQSTIMPQVIPQQPPQNKIMENPRDELFASRGLTSDWFNAFKIASPFKEIEDKFMKGFGMRKRQI